MANDRHVDINKYLGGVRSTSGGRAETEGVSVANQPEREMRAQLEKELHPDYYQRQLKERGRSR
jgi:hypothetical protein